MPCDPTRLPDAYHCAPEDRDAWLHQEIQRSIEDDQVLQAETAPSLIDFWAMGTLGLLVLAGLWSMAAEWWRERRGRTRR